MVNNITQKTFDIFLIDTDVNRASKLLNFVDSPLNWVLKKVKIYIIYTYISLVTQRCPGCSLLITLKIYLRLVVNSDLKYFPYNSGPTQLRISKVKTKLRHSRDSPKFPYQNLRQICPGVEVLWSDIQTENTTFYIYIIVNSQPVH